MVRYSIPSASAARAISSSEARPSDQVVWQWTKPRTSSSRTRSSGSAPALAQDLALVLPQLRRDRRQPERGV